MSTLFPVAGCSIYIGGQLSDKSTDFIASDFATQTWTLIDGWSVRSCRCRCCRPARPSPSRLPRPAYSPTPHTACPLAMRFRSLRPAHCRPA